MFVFLKDSDVSSSQSTSRFVRGVRFVAIFEGVKGLLVLVAGFGLLALIHRDLQSIAEHIVGHFHLNPARHYPRIFIEAAARTSDTQLRTMAGFAFLYTAVRFIEAFGLWRARPWAEWFAIISGAVYIPIEVFELYEHATWVRGLILVLNLGIVAYLLRVRVGIRRGDGARH